MLLLSAAAGCSHLADVNRPAVPRGEVLVGLAVLSARVRADEPHATGGVLGNLEAALDELIDARQRRSRQPHFLVRNGWLRRKNPPAARRWVVDARSDVDLHGTRDLVRRDDAREEEELREADNRLVEALDAGGRWKDECVRRLGAWANGRRDGGRADGRHEGSGRRQEREGCEPVACIAGD